MKSILKITTLLMMVGTMMASCHRDSPLDIQGPKGEKGDQGEQGVSIQSIKTDPNDNSKAIITLTDGSKETINLPQGPAGAAGADGSMIYAGNGAPDDSKGTDHDYYLDKSTGELYGPKSGSSWGTSPLSIMGPAGPKGDKGDPGKDGATILSGSNAPTSSDGMNGDFYLDLTTMMIYGPKTNAGWGSGISLKGAKGDKGDPGMDGADGATILSGSSAPTGSDGANGDFYIDLSSMMIYGPKTNTGWGSGTNLKGDKGDPGAQVIYSDWIKPEKSDIVQTKNHTTNPLDYNVYKITVNEPAITAGIKDSGTVMVYYRITNPPVSLSNTAVEPLPILFTQMYSATVEFKMYFSFGINLHRLTIRMQDMNNNTNLTMVQDLLIPDPTSGAEFRYVIIPGNKSVARTSSPRPDLKDYNAVREYYGIPK